MHFLRLLAHDLMKKYDGRFEDLTIIFPNKRAGLFLAEELSKLIGQPVWMPKILTISEFVHQYSGLKIADDLTLTVKLYKTYRLVSGMDERFDDFYYWGNMLLSDFDDVDKYLVDAKSLFSNVSSLKEMESDLSFLSEVQIEAIQMFWSTFNPTQKSNEQEEFLKVWDKLYPVYKLFREMLYKEQLCYEGMGLRHFYEHIREFEYPGQLVFAGFNALNFCEKQIFKFFRDNKNAIFYWDYDIYYTSNKYHEAGMFLRENLSLFPNQLGQEHFNHFLYNGKKISYISVPSGIGQAKLLPELLQADPREGYAGTAIVLCDENLLLPVIHSLPPDIGKINVTMGYPARNTSIAELITLLNECVKYTKTEGDHIFYYYKPVIALLNHHLVKNLSPAEIDDKIERIRYQNSIYLSPEELAINPLTTLIFPVNSKRPDILVSDILEGLLLYINQESIQIHPIEKELIFELYTRIQALNNSFEEENIIPDQKLYLQIIQKVLQSLSIAFSGEPLEKLQLMGLLETRMLDFKNLIILSANEGMIPKISVNSSFIPYNLRVGFKMPTQEHQDALYAYYFYRLIQRAENVRILYSTANKGIHSSEMSRYLFQIKYESGLNIEEVNFQNSISVQDNYPIEVQKDEEMIRKMKEMYSTPENYLSPSALNIYLECPLRFYFRYIAGIKEKEEVEEELDHRLMGNIFHECSRAIYTPYTGKDITADIIDRILKDTPLLDGIIRTSYYQIYDRKILKILNNGGNELILGVVLKYLKQMLTYDKQLAPFQMISMENSYKMPVELEDTGKIFLGGSIDRIDLINQDIRIIDYKTGADDTHFKTISDLFDPENKTRNKAAFQTLLYCLIYDYDCPGNKNIIPGIYSLKLMFSKDYNHCLKIGNQSITHFEYYKEEFREKLMELLREIFSPEKTFSQTREDKKCRNCPYREVCNR